MRVTAQKVAVLATLDTKAEEAAYAVDRIRSNGWTPWLVDIGTGGSPRMSADVDRDLVAVASGHSLSELQVQSKSDAMTSVTVGATEILRAAIARGEVAGVFAIGGGQGTWLAATIMRGLPLGLPKVILTTIASRAALHLGASDIVMVPSVTDIAGMNRIFAPILAGAVGSILGMIEGRNVPIDRSKPLVGMTMFGVTTIGGEEVRRMLEDAGREVAVFHANGTGGRVLESLVGESAFQGVLDFTTTELVDELVGGIASAGPHRLEAACDSGVPLLFVPGALDVINFGPPESVPASFANRLFHQHTPVATLMRTSVEESLQLAVIVAKKLARAKGEVRVLIPAGGFSSLDSPGEPFHDPVADAAFTNALRQLLDATVPMIVDSRNINDPAFAALAAEQFLALTQSETPAIQRRQ